MQKRYDDVLIFCPEVKTGGPEALHQLAHCINLHGGRAHMVYYAPYSRVEIAGGAIICHAPASPMPAHFARYHPQILTTLRPTPRTLLIFPEPLCHLAAVQTTAYQRALWWLSLDNALPEHAALLTQPEFFADETLIHFHQSDYARHFLTTYNAPQYHPLSDYTDEDFTRRALIASDNPPPATRPHRIAYFPNKGAERAARFTPPAGADFLPLRGLTKPELRDILFTTRLYIDFGHHPGKDRIPREAAAAGAVILLHQAGAALHFADHPLPRDYLFTEADILSGRLTARAAAILANPEPHLARQQQYRASIATERARFDLEVQTLFFTHEN